MRTDFKLYKVDMKYIRNLHNIDDKVLSVSPQRGKERCLNFPKLETECEKFNSRIRKGSGL